MAEVILEGFDEWVNRIIVKNNEKTKKCTSCLEEKNLSEFYGRKDTGKLQSQCKTCIGEKVRIRYGNNKEYRRAYIREWQHSNPHKVKKYARDTYLRGRADFKRCVTKTLDTKRSQCNKSNTEFNITAQDIEDLFLEQDGKCELTGRSLIWGSEGIIRDTLSIDRLDQDLGYTRDNIRLVTYQANFARNRFGDSELIDFCVSVLEHSQIFSITSL